MRLTYKKTLISCFVGYIVQAISVNFLPLLFVMLQDTYQVSLGQLTALITVHFGVQLLMDFAEACSELATMEKNPKLEGRFMAMFLTPKTSKSITKDTEGEPHYAQAENP